MTSRRLNAAASLDAQMRDILAAEIGKAIALLDDATLDRGAVLHQTRKRFKAIRAFLRLVRSGDPAFHDAENARYRDLARNLAAGREASALVETVDRFAASARKADVGALDAVRRHFEQRRDVVHGDDAAIDTCISDAAQSCRNGLGRLGDLHLAGTGAEEADILADGAAASIRAARKALAACEKRAEDDDFHDLRKATKRHFAQLDLIGDLWPGPLARRRRRLKTLGEALGDLNDIAVMRARMDEIDCDALADEAAAFDKRLARREKALRKRCVGLARPLFDIRPKAVRQAIRAGWDATPVDEETPSRAAA